MAFTADEQLLIALYRITQDAEDPDETVSWERLELATGWRSRKVVTLVKELERANFLKRDKTEGVFLTAHGAKLAAELLQET